MPLTLSEMDWIRAALANAASEQITVQDILRLSEHAKTARDLDTAVNLYAQMK